MQNRLKRSGGGMSVTVQDVESSSTVIFSVFSRYGDSVIAFKVINEFISAYPGKRYIVITTNQALPYARKLITSGRAELHSINKRKNPVKFIKIVSLLKNAGADLGFNPWSQGEDSEYFITFARKFSFYGRSSGFSKEYNLYDRAREYLLLKGKGAGVRRPRGPKDVRNIILAPFSTDVTKSLDEADIKRLVAGVKGLYPGASVTIALQDNEVGKAGVDGKKFIFKKKLKSSERFLELLEATDLFIGIDAGPLHLADALGLKVIGIFGPTAPETILDRSCSNVTPIRHRKLQGYFCFVRECRDPVCIHELFSGDFLRSRVDADFSREIVLETKVCKVG